MENTELIGIWKTQNEKLEKTLTINEILLKELINNKARTSLRSLIKLKTAGIIAFVLYLLLLGNALAFAIAHYSSAWNYFIVSVAVIALVNVKGFADYIKHLVWANNINYNGSVMQIQQQLSKLQLSIIDHARMMCLQIPFYTTFYLSNSWFPHEVGLGYILFQVSMTTTFVVFSYWLYKNHKPENLDKKWFRNLIAGSGGKSVMEAMQFYKELEEFSKDETASL
ncbi:MAG TPA: hypothetical protein PLC76_04380 [Saprospiraceae bacterium]|jgi:hypothetical protein|nr:MAG: hypothetical protein UZ08_BCD001002186 [Candidatus Parvibacillus calidus]MBX2938289.1 hypothetical protein [Saprospiraceae bacterium]MBK7741219.1 hypothetical protein [Candidatus Parvibacillus calidus]MBX7179634.1 hypothetical protein [Saprospiraceae bacterium]MCB0590214.1 hypothetical protein [Saprospiraceae bacterium]